MRHLSIILLVAVLLCGCNKTEVFTTTTKPVDVYNNLSSYYKLDETLTYETITFHNGMSAKFPVDGCKRVAIYNTGDGFQQMYDTISAIKLEVNNSIYNISNGDYQIDTRAVISDDSDALFTYTVEVDDNKWKVICTRKDKLVQVSGYYHLYDNTYCKFTYWDISDDKTLLTHNFELLLDSADIKF